MRFHRITLIILYTLTLACLIYLTKIGLEYYRLPQIERPHHALHTELKPGGFVGHGVGVTGSLMMMLLLAYSIRKRFRFMRGKGDIRYWLNYHIWLGITGPLLVIFHSSFKVHGIIAVSFWSMAAVALSGVFGRFLYQQIPRSASGEDLSASETRQREASLTQRLREDFQLTDKIIDTILKMTGIESEAQSATYRAMFRWFLGDLALPLTEFKLRKRLRIDFNLGNTQVRNVITLARELAMLKRRIAFLGKVRRILHYWHIVHRPFAAVMIIIMLIHSVIAALFGYRWIF